MKGSLILLCLFLQTKHIKMKRVVVQQEEPAVCESPVVDLISSDGKITQKKLEETRVQLTGVRQLDHTPYSVTDKTFNFTGLNSLSVCLSD